MGGAVLLRVLVMVVGVHVSGDGLCLSVAYECGVWSGMFSVLTYLCIWSVWLWSVVWCLLTVFYVRFQ